MAAVASGIDRSLFDESSGYDDEIGAKLAHGLTDDEKQQAQILYGMFNELWGVCLVVGDPGTGKDVFGNFITHRLKTYFPWKRVLRDEKPRALYGHYEGLFNEEVLSEDLGKMRELAVGVPIAKVREVLERAADDWVTNKGEVLLKNSVLYLTEIWRYFSSRKPHSPMNITMGGVHKEKRHIDLLEIGTTQLETELDKKTYLPWVDWKVTCTRSVANKTGFAYYVTKVKYDRRMDLLTPISKPVMIAVDAGKPRSRIGEGKIIIRKPEYQPDTEEERVVLNVLKAGVNKYEDIVGLLETQGDMMEREVLETLKELKFRRTKHVIDYPCDFGLFNSKSAPNMKPSVRIAE